MKATVKTRATSKHRRVHGAVQMAFSEWNGKPTAILLPSDDSPDGRESFSVREAAKRFKMSEVELRWLWAISFPTFVPARVLKRVKSARDVALIKGAIRQLSLAQTAGLMRWMKGGRR